MSGYEDHRGEATAALDRLQPQVSEYIGAQLLEAIEDAA